MGNCTELRGLDNDRVNTHQDILYLIQQYEQTSVVNMNAEPLVLNKVQYHILLIFLIIADCFKFFFTYPIFFFCIYEQLCF